MIYSKRIFPRRLLSFISACTRQSVSVCELPTGESSLTPLIHHEFKIEIDIQICRWPDATPCFYSLCGTNIQSAYAQPSQTACKWLRASIIFKVIVLSHWWVRFKEHHNHHIGGFTCFYLILRSRVMMLSWRCPQIAESRPIAPRGMLSFLV